MLVTGLALIVLPILAVILKFFSFGWMMFFVIYGPIVLMVGGYILQVVIAAQGFLARRPLWTGGARTRAVIAAWSTSVAVVLVGIFMPDGGDTGYGSTFQVWLGAYSGGPHVEAMHDATDGLSAAISYAAGVVWVLAFFWLVIEWIIGLTVRSRRSRSDVLS